MTLKRKRFFLALCRSHLILFLGVKNGFHLPKLIFSWKKGRERKMYKFENPPAARYGTL